MNNYQYDDLTTMYLDKKYWIHLAHQGSCPTIAAPLWCMFTLLPPIGRRWLLLSVSVRAGNGGILLVVVRAIRLPSVVVQIQALLTAQRAGIS
jgi:hypothetical protein